MTLPDGARPGRVLEVGAGTGHHFPYVAPGSAEYVMTDASGAMIEIARAKYRSEVASGRLQLQRQDAARLTYDDQSFDRLIAAHILEHLPNPVDVLAEWNRVVTPGGLISIVLPCDPGLLWRLGRCLGPRRNAERAGIAYDYLVATEHVNSIFNLVSIIRYHFEIASALWYPARIPAPDLNLFYVCHLRKIGGRRASVASIRT
jgi:ubiquinone/menaquinone biosynthesis C-methylase UbiE